MSDAMNSNGTRPDVAIIGGGLAGMIAAVLTARRSRSVVVFEQSKLLGGRAITTEKEGVKFNLGPRALYQLGDAHRLLKELKIPFSGAPPNPGLPLCYFQNHEYRLPTTRGNLLMTRLLSLRDKWRLAIFLNQLPGFEVATLSSISTADWIQQRFGNGALGHLIATLIRLTTYAGDLSRLSTAAAIEQLRLALAGNVLYVDGGWNSLIEGLREAAIRLGVQIRTRFHVESVECHQHGVLIKETHGACEQARTAILAVGPQAAGSMLRLPVEHSLVEWSARQQPIRAACLDVALKQLPRPKHRFALGLESSLYFSVHSAAAELAPDGIAVAHVMKYLPSHGVESAGAVEQELEQFLDRVQPGWRNNLLTQRTLPLMTVAHCHPEPFATGTASRPGVAVEGYPGIYVAGDWVGTQGQIADAAAASAEAAANGVLNDLLQSPLDALQHV